MSKKSFIGIGILCLLTFPIARAQPSVTSIPEMQQLPLENLGDLDPDYFISEEEQSEWDEVQSFVDSWVSSQLIRDLSLYAQKQMEAYVYVPGRDTDLTLVSAHPKHIVYEVTLDELPSHAPLVKRYLKLYIVALRYEKRFLPNHFYITVRGERLE